MAVWTVTPHTSGKTGREKGGSAVHKRWITDLVMTATLLLLMGYSLIGEAVHEWLGATLLVLIILHHVWNRAWYKGLDKGRMSIYRAVQTILTFLLLFSVLGSLLSGLILSQYIADFLPLDWGQDWARTVHLPCAFWSFLLMGLHLGLHWSIALGTVRRISRRFGTFGVRPVILRLIGAAIACYGLVAFFRNNFLDCLLLRTHFLFFLPDQTTAGFLVDYLSILGLFTWVGHYGGNSLRRNFSNKKVSQ